MKIETKIKKAYLKKYGILPGSGLASIKNELFFFVTDIHDNICIISKSNKSSLEEQVIELFPNFDFSTNNCYQTFLVALCTRNALGICFVNNKIEGINYYVKI